MTTPTKEKQAQYDKAKYARNSEIIKARARAYYHAHRAECLSKKREYYQANREQRLSKSREWAEANPDRVARTIRYSVLAKKYGITEGQYIAMLEKQSGKCAICEKEPAEGKYLCVDHDHNSGAVRGLLCRNCNAAIGQLNDSVDMLNRAITYLTLPTKD